MVIKLAFHVTLQLPTIVSVSNPRNRPSLLPVTATMIGPLRLLHACPTTARPPLLLLYLFNLVFVKLTFSKSLLLLCVEMCVQSFGESTFSDLLALATWTRDNTIRRRTSNIDLRKKHPRYFFVRRPKKKHPSWFEGNL
ncbi:hypothetical protein L2E82_17242 [Cichorium intybus]|uniref:Uncharacterized protein n=2 Tax=Cichorium intybus TaxID=13427 RepID=A0ACB9D342_CICIN|nr:hypothetical protein L2E82_31282 [Cichorium intybus]KAI3767155.1 hypothetical protein L2E82_17242 [Cichorium intybus]